MKKLIFLLSIITFNVSAQNATPAEQAEENNTEVGTVLFKISNIKPIKNKEDVTVACGYDITMYNRTEKDLSNIGLSLHWKDTTVEQKIEKEKKQPSKNVFSRGSSKTEQFDYPTINTTVSLPPVPAKKQILKRLEISTNKCFLLINKASYQINSCNFSSIKSGNEKGRGSASTCKDSFFLIDSNDGNYYTEFSDKNYDVLEQEKENKIQKEIDEINNLYTQSKEAISKLENTVNAI
ncbi:MAG: hypothetical protein R3Y43_07370 [Alphaproteobacteria bacterium]